MLSLKEENSIPSNTVGTAASMKASNKKYYYKQDREETETVGVGKVTNTGSGVKGGFKF